MCVIVMLYQERDLPYAQPRATESYFRCLYTSLDDLHPPK
eukprot:COSAG01_NODE_60158_length_296_cov_0.781726_1_plen_39_part_10